MRCMSEYIQCCTITIALHIYIKFASLCVCVLHLLLRVCMLGGYGKKWQKATNSLFCFIWNSLVAYSSWTSWSCFAWLVHMVDMYVECTDVNGEHICPFWNNICNNNAFILCRRMKRHYVCVLYWFTQFIVSSRICFWSCLFQLFIVNSSEWVD